MRRLLIALATVVLATTSSKVQAQETLLGTYNFSGCDAFSCHTAQIDLFNTPLYQGFFLQGARLNGSSVWSVSAAFSDCIGGCVWSVNDLGFAGGNADTHVDNPCYVYGAPLTPVTPMQYCTSGGTWNLQPREWVTAPNWIPQWVDVQMAYQDNPGVVSTIRLTAVPVTTVPEPSTYLLMATGLGALGLVARRRRTS